jgi:hypothetical protein
MKCLGWAVKGEMALLVRLVRGQVPGHVSLAGRDFPPVRRHFPLVAMTSPQLRRTFMLYTAFMTSLISVKSSQPVIGGI